MLKKTFNPRQSVINTISFMGFLLWMLHYFNASALYFELLVFHEKIIPITILAAIWIITILASIILNRKITFGGKQAVLLVLVVYMLAITLFNYINTPNLLNLIGVSSFASSILHIVLLLVLLAQMAMPGRISPDTITKWLFILSVPVVYFGISQVIYGYSDITKMIFDDYVNNVPYNFYGFNRPYSFFTQASNFGWFMAFLAALLWLCIINSQSVLVRGVFFFALTFVVAANILSFTRVSILAMLLVLFFIWYSKGVTDRRIITGFMPAIFFAFSIVLFFLASDLSALLKSFLGVFAYSHSTSIREDEFYYYIALYINSEWSQILIGIGPVIDEVVLKTNLFIDNTYLYVILEYGAAGFFLWMVVMVIIWRDMYLLARKEPTVLRKAIVAFYSTWLAVGVFATSFDLYILMAILFYMIKPKTGWRSSVNNLLIKKDVASSDY